ncbi:MAG: RNA-binding cell elongation regulator Jag/EloR [Candidatus Promineifilaceae bacterium]|nr:RNA-binding cell elongation regulator Jag/EloR [Candidatus Promineifilaceae bacterium]
MSDRVVLAHGSDIEEAIENGLQELGLSRNEVLVEVVDEGRRGLLGLGSREAAVRLTAISRSSSSPLQEAPPQEATATKAALEVQPAPTPEPEEVPPAELETAGEQAEGAVEAEQEVVQVAPEPSPEAVAAPTAQPEPTEIEEEEEAATEEAPAVGARDQETAEIAVEVVRELVEKLGFEEATVSASFSEADDRTGRVMAIVEINGDDLGALIGARGETLQDLQYIARLMVGHALRRRADFVIDVNAHRQKREEALARLAERMAEKALRRGEAITLEPMSSYDRRLIHVALRDDERVYTNSVGEGSSRRVRIYLREEE